jgi:WD domain, G-beta repeat
VRIAAAQQQPILRVETGMHTAPINGAATDAAGHILATASDDKAVRLWSLSDGAPIRVFRPRIGYGHEGKFNAVAISADGKSVVAGGYRGYQWEKSVCLYLFAACSGITGLGLSPVLVPRRPLHRRCSRRNERYSHFLGCGLAGSCADADCADLSTAIAFDRSGRLAAVAHDGFIRLYDKEFQRIAKVETPGGKHPSMVAFSPDATRLVVGYETAPPSTC